MRAFASSPILIGREAELDDLLGAVLTPPALVLVEGEPGVGKSRLVAELLQRPELEGHRKLLGRSHPLREPLPLGAIVDALRSEGGIPEMGESPPLLGALRTLLPEMSHRLPPAPEASADARAQRHLLFRAVAAAISQPGPTVCVLEDLHWADESTEELVRYLSVSFPSDLALVLTCRREDLHDSSPFLSLPSYRASAVPTVRIRLEPLDARNVRHLLEAIMEGGRISDDVVDHIHDRTAGIPFAVEELARLIDEREDVITLPGRRVPHSVVGLGVPTAIRDAIIERCSRLTPEARRVVNAAAVLGVGANEHLLARVAGLSSDHTRAGIDEVLGAAVLMEVSPALYGFRHSLAADALYQSISRPEQRRLHERAARTLEAESSPPVAQLAHHYREAGQAAESARWSEVAGDLALSFHDDAMAARLFQQALVEGRPEAGARERLAVKLGWSALRGLAHTDALSLLEELLTEPSLSTPVRGEIRFCVGLILVMSGDGRRGREEQTRSVCELTRRPGLQARVMKNLAEPWTAEGSVDEHLRWLRRAVRVADRQDDSSVKLTVQVARALVLLSLGCPEGWTAIEEIPWASTASIPERDELVWAALGAARSSLVLGYNERARSFLDNATGRWREGVCGPAYLPLESVRVLLEFATGTWEGLCARAQRHTEATVDATVWSLPARLVMGWVTLAGGELGAAESWFRGCLDLAAGAQAALEQVGAAAGLARVGLLRGDAADAWQHSSGGLEVLSRKGTWVWGADLLPIAVEAAISADHAPEARDLTAAFAAGVHARDAPVADAAVGVCRGLLAEADGDHDGAAAAFTAAAGIYRGLPRPYEAALATARSGMCLTELDRRTGTQVMARALDDLKELGATGDIVWIGNLYRRRFQGTIHRHRGGRRGYGRQLSPREREVAEMAAQGKTNDEIAAALFLSPRTVEQHLAQALRKLQLRSRRELNLELLGSAGPV